MDDLQFAPFKSFVDASFFSELSNRKLNDLQLSEREVGIYATYNVPMTGDKEPSLSVSGTSFGNFEENYLTASPPVYKSPGTILNLNTIESFKEFDKQIFIRKKGNEIIKAIKDGTAIENPSILSTFTILAFSDLKKYKFYYWFAFPAITSIEWSSISPPRIADEAGLTESISKWRKESSTDASQRGFFLLKQDNSSGEWIVGNLKDHGTFWNSIDEEEKMVGFSDPCTITNVPGWPLRNFIYLLGHLNVDRVKILVHRDNNKNTPASKSFWLDLSIKNPITTDYDDNSFKITGWERNSNGKLAPKMSDLGSLINPRQLADQAVDLNLKLMKWRVAPELDLQTIKDNKCLILGAGTLGSYVSRALMGWGVRKITFVDSGKVSYSNPVRQSLYKFDDCLDGGVSKAKRAAEAVKEIYPSVDSEGHELEIPMLGHPLTNESNQLKGYEQLVNLIEAHDTIFLLMDSRESRWLPSVIGCSKRKLIINVALGFDSYVVMRHGIIDDNTGQPNLGCYFCNDVVAPMDSLSNQTLDQMCTVTRPGVSMLASSLSVELLASILQHPLKGLAPPPNDNTDSTTILSEIPHQMRGFLHNFEIMKIRGPSYSACSACSPSIRQEWEADGWEFIKKALNERGYVEEVSGLAEVQRQADELDAASDWGIDSDEGPEGI